MMTGLILTLLVSFLLRFCFSCFINRCFSQVIIICYSRTNCCFITRSFFASWLFNFRLGLFLSVVASLVVFIGILVCYYVAALIVFRKSDGLDNFRTLLYSHLVGHWLFIFCRLDWMLTRSSGSDLWGLQFLGGLWSISRLVDQSKVSDVVFLDISLNFIYIFLGATSSSSVGEGCQWLAISSFSISMFSF